MTEEREETAPRSAGALEDFAKEAEADFAELVQLTNALAQKAKALGSVLRIRPQTSGFLEGRARLLEDTANDLSAESGTFLSWLRAEPKKDAPVLRIADQEGRAA